MEIFKHVGKFSCVFIQTNRERLDDKRVDKVDDVVEAEGGGYACNCTGLPRQRTKGTEKKTIHGDVVISGARARDTHKIGLHGTTPVALEILLHTDLQERLEVFYHKIFDHVQ